MNLSMCEREKLHGDMIMGWYDVYKWRNYETNKAYDRLNGAKI